MTRESTSIGDFYPSCIDSPGLNLAIEFDRTTTLPPDIVTIRNGLLGAHILRAQQLGLEIYHGLSPRAQRVLDLGCGVGSFLVGVLAGQLVEDTELIGVDIDSSALAFAKTNVLSGIRRVYELNPSLKVDTQMIAEDWFSEGLWQDLGMFDLIYLNPPYLREDEKPLSGFESVPTDQIYHERPMDQYESLTLTALRHLSFGGSLVMRLHSKSDLGTVTRDITISDRASFVVVEEWYPYSPDRQGHTITYTRWEKTLPPYGDPNVLLRMYGSLDQQTKNLISETTL